MSNEAATTLRDFIRGNGKADGALDALDALHELEQSATTTAEMIAREGEFSAALHHAQQAARAAVKDSAINLRTGGGYSVAETEQLIQICREAIGEHGLSIVPGGEQVIQESGALFLRIRYGIRHVRGFVEWTDHDWPINLSGGQQVQQNNRRGTSTSALGYFIRDVLLLERRKDESEGGASQPRRQSGPRRSPARKPAPPPISAKAEAVISRLQGQSAEAVEKAENWLADMREVEGRGGFSDADFAAMEKAIEERKGSAA